MMIWFIIFILLPVGIFFITRYFLQESTETIDVRDKAVFISGCDSGFGQALAIRLDQLKMKVIAGCLTEKGGNELRARCSPELLPVILDITKVSDIENAAKIVSTVCPKGIWALVNNAGIGHVAEWDWCEEKDLRKVMEINFFGHVAMTRAMLPHLKKTKGRIVNVISLAGNLALPRIGAYSCSKFAMEAFSDSLRREMHKWGISVFSIEPGFTATPMVNGFKPMLEKTWEATSDETKREYGEEYAQGILNAKAPRVDPPGPVIDTLVNKVTLKYPSPRTRTGVLAKIGYVLHTFLPTSWFDMIQERQERKKPLPAVISKKQKQL